MHKNHEAAIREGCYFDEEKADRAIRFIENYCVPVNLGQPIVLLEWQRQIVRDLFGWHRADGLLRFRRATISAAKKNGKTILLSAIILYGLYGGLCPAPLCASASTARENASQVYRELANSIRRSEKLAKVSKCLDSMKEIRCVSKTARYKALSADSAASEGENLFLCVVDEGHAHKSDKLYRSLEYSTVARQEGLFINISTAGSDQSHFFHEVFQYALSVQKGDIIDTTLYSAIFTPDATDDIENPATWYKSNPSLGTSFSVADFSRELQRAKADTGSYLSFRRYRLNMWTAPDDAYIPSLKFDSCVGKLNHNEYQTAPLYVGVDLSQTTDPCSISLVWVLGDKKYYSRTHSFVCEGGLKQREKYLFPRYQQYQQEGVLTITKGGANDYKAIKQFLLNLKLQYNLQEIVFDQFNALEMAHELLAQNIKVYRQPQTARYYNNPCKELGVSFTEKRIIVEPNNMLKWCLQNTIIEVDKWGNQSPSRSKSTEKIDCAVSLLMGFGRAIENTAEKYSRKSIYETEGLKII